MTWAIWTGGPTPARVITNPQPITTADGVQHPASVWTRWSAADLAAKLSAYPFVQAQVPAGHRVVSTGYVLKDGVVTEVYETEQIQLSKEELHALNTECRWQVETGGLDLNGFAVLTMPEDQARILGAYSTAKEFPNDLVDFKAATGWIQLDSATIIAIGKAVGIHVRECFRREKSVYDGIEAGSITTPEAVRHAWGLAEDAGTAGV